jgi:hypothetical protein
MFIQIFSCVVVYESYRTLSRSLTGCIGHSFLLVKKTIKKAGLSMIGSIQNYCASKSVSYHLELPPTMHIHPVFHVSLLESYKTSQIPSRILPPPLPIKIDHNVEYEVEEILDSCLQHQRLEYFIH